MHICAPVRRELPAFMQHDRARHIQEYGRVLENLRGKLSERPSAWIELESLVSLARDRISPCFLEGLRQCLQHMKKHS